MAGLRRAFLAEISVAIVLLSGAAVALAGEEPLTLPDSQLEPVTWADVKGWAGDDHLAAFAAYRRSCQPFLKVKEPRDERPVYEALWEVCRRAARLRPATSEAARKFFEANFSPVRIARIGEADGFLTGYYEPIVQGSRFPSPEFHVPLYRRPPDLLVGGQKPGSESVANKGVSIGRRNESNDIVPYYDRAEIEHGALDGQKLEICWLRDPFEALSIAIQGSARVILEDGTILRVGYDAHNGHPYMAVGRVLIERNLVPREEISIQRIRDWMAANPDEAPRVRAANRSFVFFRITGLSNEGEPTGAQGVPLTPLRSIAVDKIHVYGTPFFIEASLPIDSAKPVTPFRRLMVAQDTGSAIVGPARADLYWGSGEEAGRIAGRIRHPGRFVMLLPRQLDMIEAGKHAPLPAPKPVLPEPAAKAPEPSLKPAAGQSQDKPARKSPRQAGPTPPRPRT
ncbi:MAG TPA: MltA domain-containing protein [Xanthobacteraceae bacterium]|jgi:membrane-bound lytic murein transglycosylase A